MHDVIRCFKTLGLVEKSAAKLQFLQTVRDLRCDDCCECFVRTGDDFPVELERGTELKLAVTCSCLLFFARDPWKCLLPLELSDILSVETTDQQLFLLIQHNGKRIRLHLETDNRYHLLHSLQEHGCRVLKHPDEGLHLHTSLSSLTLQCSLLESPFSQRPSAQQASVSGEKAYPEMEGMTTPWPEGRERASTLLVGSSLERDESTYQDMHVTRTLPGTFLGSASHKDQEHLLNREK